MRWSRVRADQVREAADGRPSRLVHAVTDTLPVDPADHEREELVHDVVVRRPAAAGRVSLPGEQGSLSISRYWVTVLGERFRDVDHEEVGQQELGQRVIALIVQRPVGLAVQAVVEGQVGIEPGPVCFQVVRTQPEYVFRIVKIPDFNVTVKPCRAACPT
jgi:hypothetical protein